MTGVCFSFTFEDSIIIFLSYCYLFQTTINFINEYSIQKSMSKYLLFSSDLANPEKRCSLSGHGCCWDGKTISDPYFSNCPRMYLNCPHMTLYSYKLL